MAQETGGDAIAAPTDAPPAVAAATDVAAAAAPARGLSEAAKEARLLSQLLLFFSAKRARDDASWTTTASGSSVAAVAAALDLADGHVAADVSADGVRVDADAGVDAALASASASLASQLREMRAMGVDIPFHMDSTSAGTGTDAAGAARARVNAAAPPSERALIKQYLALSEASQKRVAQSLFVIPPSLVDRFASVLEFFMHIIMEAHARSARHLMVAARGRQGDDSDGGDAATAEDVAPAKSTTHQQADDEHDAISTAPSCAWAANCTHSCVDTASAEAATQADLREAPSTAPQLVFQFPPGFHSCLVTTYGSTERNKCEEVWHGDHMAYRCRTCGLSDSSCMCLACFDADDHEGHDFCVYRCSSGGCCDCGDPLAWKSSGFCKKHRADAEADAACASLGDMEAAVVHDLVRRVAAFCVNVLREVFFFCIRPSATEERMAASAEQAAVPRALPKTGRNRASFPSILQIRIDRLQQSLAWLQMLTLSCVPYRDLVSQTFFETLPSDFVMDPDVPPSAGTTASASMQLSSSTVTDTKMQEGKATSVVTASPPRSPHRSDGISGDLRILDVFLKAGVLLPVDVCDTLGVLYLKLLFHPEFKRRYRSHFVDWYPYILELYLQASEEGNDDGLHNISRFVDRLFCQLFHSVAQLEELEETFLARHRQDRVNEALGVSPSCLQWLMTFLVTKLAQLFEGCTRVDSLPTRAQVLTESTMVRSIRVVDCGRNVLKKLVYARLSSDLRTLLVHPSVAAQVLLASFAPSTPSASSRSMLQLQDHSAFAELIRAVQCLQWMDLQQCSSRRHVEFESQHWTTAFVVDHQIALLVSTFASGLKVCLAGDGDSTTGSLVPLSLGDAQSKWDLAFSLIQPLVLAVRQWSLHSGRGAWIPRQTDADIEAELSPALQAIEMASFYSTRVMAFDAGLKRSFHLPLHRSLAQFLQGVSLELRPRTRQDWQRLLFGHLDNALSLEDQSFLYQVADAVLTVAMFAREVHAGMWIRNGGVMWQQLIHYHAKHWRANGLHNDLLLAQLAALMLPRGAITRLLWCQSPVRFERSRVLALLAAIRSNETSSADETQTPSLDVGHEIELVEQLLRFVLQLVLSPVRLAACGSPVESATWMLEREVMHWLSLGPCTRSDVVAHVDVRLMEQIRQTRDHEWSQLEEEEILSMVLDRVGKHDDPCAGPANAASVASLFGCGLKMTGTWSLQPSLWPRISPLFECFTPSEAEECEQNVRKKRPDSVLVALPGADEPHAEVASTLAQQMLDSSALLSTVLVVLWNWSREEDAAANATGQDPERVTSESLVVTALSVLVVAVSMLEDLDIDQDDAAGASEVTDAATIDDPAHSWECIERRLESCQGWIAKLCIEFSAGDDETESILQLVLRLATPSEHSREILTLSSQILALAEAKSTRARTYLHRKRQQQASDMTHRPTVDDSERLLQAKALARQRQQMILDKMKAQQQQFLSAMDDDSDDQDGENSISGRRNASRSDGSSDDEEGERVSGDEDDEEDDEWGFPTGHVDVTLYLDHLASALSHNHDGSARRARRRRASHRKGGAHSTSGSTSDDGADELQCGLCRLACEAHPRGATFGYVGMIITTGLPSKLQLTSPPPPWQRMEMEDDAESSEEDDEDDDEDSHRVGDTLVWTCGHAVHQECIQAYLDSLWRERGRSNALHAGDDRLLSERDREFLCPICRRLANCVIPDAHARCLRDDDSDVEESKDEGHDPPRFISWLNEQLETTPETRSWSCDSSSQAEWIAVTPPQPAMDDVDRFCKTLRMCSVRASMLLPLLQRGDMDDELTVDAEIRRMAASLGEAVPSWRLLLRSVEVSVDVLQHEGALLRGIDSLDRPRQQSLQLLLNAAATAVATHDQERSEMTRSVQRDREIVFGQRVLIADYQDSDFPTDELEHDGPLLSLVSMDKIFLTSVVHARARAIGAGHGPQEDADAACHAYFEARVLVAAQILQALGALCLTPFDGTSESGAGRLRRRSRILTDFEQVETLPDALEWMHLLYGRARLLGSTSRCFPMDTARIEAAVVQYCLPLLRRLVLLLNACFPSVTAAHDGSHAVDGSDACAVCDGLYAGLPQATGSTTSTEAALAEDAHAEMHSYLRHLHLPPLRLFFHPLVFPRQQRELCQAWAAQVESKAAVLRQRQRQRQRTPRATEVLESELDAFRSLLPVRSPSSPRLIMELPRVYMDLYKQYSVRPAGVCQRCQQVPQHPALCLFCGTVLCCFSSCSDNEANSQIGACTAHAQSCALGIGAFLLLRACTVILLLGNERRCMWGSLYVDKNGEEDPYMRRGKSLFLAPQRLAALETLLVTHSFTQNTAILANTSRRDGRRY